MYQSLIMGIIRPTRLTYEYPRALGPPSIAFADGSACVRQDFEVDNGRGQRLGCSVWLPTGAPAAGWPCVVYLHGNSSSRAEAVKTNVLKAVVASGSALVSFDFAGCGNAEGDYVSLGWFESQDTHKVLQELRRRGCGRVVLWGRSMGAVTALLVAAAAATAPSSLSDGVVVPAGLVLDSPFASFKALAYDLTSKGMIKVPQFATATVLSFIRRSVQKRAGFDLFRIMPVASVHTAAVPAFFLVAEDDELIPPWHAERLRRKYGGPSLGIRFAGTHNSARPAVVYAMASVFVTAINHRQPRYGPESGTLALHLLEKTAVVTSQEEEEEDGEGDPHEQRRARYQHRGPYHHYYDQAPAHTSGKAGRQKKHGQKKKRGTEEGPTFIHAGSHSVGNISGTAKALVGALDVNLAARAVEEYLLDELIEVGVAVVQAQLQAALAVQGEEPGAVLPTLTKPQVLDVVARTQQELTAAAPWASSLSANKKKQASAQLTTSWESVVYAEGREQWNETRRIVRGLRQVHDAHHHQSLPLGALPESSLPPPPPPSVFCCFNPHDAYLSEARGKEARLARVAEALFTTQHR